MTAQIQLDTIMLTNEQIDTLAAKFVGIGSVEAYRKFAQAIAQRVAAAQAEVTEANIISKALAITDGEYEEFLPVAGKNNGRESDFAFGSVNSAERIAGKIRVLGHVDLNDKMSVLEKAALVCDTAGRLTTDAPAKALFECAEKIREIKLDAEEADVTELVERAALVCDRSGHYWSGRPALTMFECAEAIRTLKNNVEIDEL